MTPKVDFVKIIKERLRISDVIGKDLKLHKSGNHYKALCPFHNEKTPSFVINDEKESYYCFGCGAKGDIFSYVMETHKVDFKESLKVLASLAGVELTNQYTKYDSSQTSIGKKKYYDIMALIAKYYHENLIKHLKSNSLSFIEQKKINLSLLKNFYLGLSNSYENLEKYLKTKSVNVDDLVDLGIVKINNNGKKYDMFTNRIMFPIKDNLNRIIAFGGRRITEEGAKYINSWENDFFKKRNILYNMRCLSSLKHRTDNLLLVEGYTDVIALHNAGYNAVAPLGTSISLEQINLAWKYVDEPVLFLDGDDAGVNASKRVLNLVLSELKPDKSLKFIILNNGKDPEQILNSEDGVKEIKDILNKKINLFETMIHFESDTELNSPERLLGFKKRLLNKLNLISDTETRDLYKVSLKRKFNNLLE